MNAGSRWQIGKAAWVGATGLRRIEANRVGPPAMFRRERGQALPSKRTGRLTRRVVIADEEKALAREWRVRRSCFTRIEFGSHVRSVFRIVERHRESGTLVTIC